MLQEIGVGNRSYDVVVSPQHYRVFERTLNLLDIQFEIVIEDLQA